jgi:non-homologous end joining protein Ku
MNAYVSQLTMHFGSATTVGSLFGIRATDNSGKYKLCTPEGGRVHQMYQDDEGNLYEYDDLARGELDEETNTISVVSDEDIKAAKESKLPDNVITLTAHDKNDVEEFLFPSGNQAYIFKPVIKKGKKVVEDPVNVQWYDFINTILRETDTALIGKCNLRNHEGLFRLGRYQGYITLQKQMYPEELNRFDEWTSSLELPVRNKANELSRRAIKGFEPKEYEDEVKKRLVKLTPGAVQNSRTVDTSPAVASEFSMLEALEEFTV